MPDSALQALIQQLLWASFALGAAFGAISQRLQFCTMGALADLVTMADASRLCMWVLAMGTAALGFNILVSLGWVEARQSLYAGTQLNVLSHALGGALFGLGMVLASGCAGKTLVRIGGGSLKALVVLLVLAATGYATLRGVVAVARVATVDAVGLPLPAGQDLPSLLAHLRLGSVRGLALAGGIVFALGAAAFALRRPEARRFDVWAGGLGIGFVVALQWWVSGQLGHLSEHPVTLEEVFLATNSRRMESLSFAAPAAYTLDWLLLFSDRSKVLTMGIAATLGVVAGSAAVALASRSFRWEGFAGVEDTANHLVGAALMGVGGVTALGCTVGQGISGVSTLSLGSFIALAGIVGGALLGLRWQVWRVGRAA